MITEEEAWATYWALRNARMGWDEAMEKAYEVWWEAREARLRREAPRTVRKEERDG